jgi:hypothetical protein
MSSASSLSANRTTRGRRDRPGAGWPSARMTSLHHADENKSLRQIAAAGQTRRNVDSESTSIVRDYQRYRDFLMPISQQALSG